MKLDRSITPYEMFLWIAAVVVLIGLGVFCYEIYHIDCTHGTLPPECIWPAPGGF